MPPAPRPDRSLCRLCGRVIGWTVGPDGRPKPYDVLADGSLGTSHFVTCKPYRERCAARDAARRRRREAELDRRQGRLF